MALSIEEVKKIAQLARLDLTSAEEIRHAETISQVLEYMKILNEVDTTQVEPTFQVTGLADVMREDVSVDSNLQKDIKEQWPSERIGQLVVPAVFKNEADE
ncbi:MAG: Asp-tRNA(Asn)/Glu-tRNA(Gln) amidotransferase subunit GatC [bacterium]|nr:Asp-tRNA(Asn)/Glu-tRNA(Gln) amidotransferase subunit GatC [bacterium]